MNSVKLYFNLIYAKITSQMQYPLSFLFIIFGNFIIAFIDVVGIYIIFQRFDMIDGWILSEICLLYGLLHMGYAVIQSFAMGLKMFPSLIRTGNFDRILLRPRSIIIQILGSDFRMENIGRFIQGAIPFVYAVISLELLDFPNILLMLLATINVYLVYFALNIIQATISFWTINGLEFMNAFTYGGLQMAQYPITIFQKWFRNFFTYIIPIGLTVYFPALVILKKSDNELYHLAPLFITLSIPICLLYIFLSLLFFRYGVRRYKSTGS